MARLHRVSPERDPGLSRSLTSRGTVRLTRPDGRVASGRDRRRVEALVIPPAWSEVWICADPLGHIQVVGTDAAGRRQYLYHPQWQSRRGRSKYERALDLAETLPRARAQVTRALRGEDLDRERVLATAFRLLDLSAVRMGSTASLRSGRSRGLTTLQRRHARVDGPVVTLAFRGKNRIEHQLELEDEDLASSIRQLIAGDPRTLLLSWREGRRRRSLTPALVNEHIAAVTGGAFTAKDFRTLHGTVIAAQTLADIGPVRGRRARAQAERAAVQATASALGNTVAVARSSYIDPRVLTRYRRGELLAGSRSPEAALRDLLRG
ncbi:DNA topoisomerase IB [Brachybacterium sp. AOP29-B2-41]|uniref:DNA topoisomerase IB n=1 Tax=Brachybacterium sp. AOP29-B2-41 TaxID=3457704 RepID=UPI0040339E7E